MTDLPQIVWLCNSVHHRNVLSLVYKFLVGEVGFYKEILVSTQSWGWTTKKMIICNGNYCTVSSVSFQVLTLFTWALFICSLLAVLILASKSSLEQDSNISVESQLTRSFNLNTFSSVSLIISEENLVFFWIHKFFSFKNPFWNVILW